MYPFSADSIPVVRFHSVYCKNYSIDSLVSLPGSGLCGHDAGFADNRDNMGMLVEEDLEKALDSRDALFVPSGDSEGIQFKEIYDSMLYAAKKGKDIICNIRMPKKKIAELRIECKRGGGKFTDFVYESGKWYSMTMTGIHKMKAPVVFVGGMMADANNFEIVLSLADRLRQDGYRVMAVGEKPEYNCLGFHGSSILMDLVRGQLWDGDVTMTIALLNHYFHYLEAMEKPDIIIVQVPGGMIDTPDFPNECGVYAYLLSRVLKPDYFICCSLYASFLQEHMRKMSCEMEARYGYPIHCVHFSNKAVSTSASLQKHKMEFIHQPLSSVKENLLLEQGKIPFYQLLDKGDLEQMYQQMIEYLSEM